MFYWIWFNRPIFNNVKLLFNLHNSWHRSQIWSKYFNTHIKHCTFPRIWATFYHIINWVKWHSKETLIQAQILFVLNDCYFFQLYVQLLFESSRVRERKKASILFSSSFQNRYTFETLRQIGCNLSMHLLIQIA